ncbi:MAG: TlyA family RNA methyltransferase [Tissierellia bacterium]|nr:TlyA family RNA methyltransferase [Tissierellia bacterium]
MAKKQRADILLVQKKITVSREKAKLLIMSGAVFADNKPVYKPGELLSEDATLSLRKEVLPFVSRGGLKLDKAINRFDLDINDYICLDIGASTGGFTDCMLKAGAKRVYSVDVGYGQLDWSLRSDNRVVVLERTNARYLSEEQVTDKIDFFTMDVSFISTSLILPALKNLLKPNGSGVVLIKPQFEAERHQVGKNGVVRKPEIHLEIIKKVILKWEEKGFYLVDLDFSPITGPKGNIEYLGLVNTNEGVDYSDIEIKTIINNAHQELIK